MSDQQRKFSARQSVGAGQSHGGIPQRRFRGNRRRQGNYVTHKELSGGRMKVPSNPPSVSYQPWMPLTVVHSGKSGSITMTVEDLVAQIKTQLDPTMHAFKDSLVLNIRIRSVRAWNLTGKMIALAVDDYSDADKAIADVDTLCGEVDTGSAAHVPAVGYEMPASHKHIVLRNGTDNSTDKKVVVYHVSCPETDTCIIYTSIFWKMDGPTKFTQFSDKMKEALISINYRSRKIQQNTDNSSDRLKKIKDITKDILSNMPSDRDSQISFLADAIADFTVDDAEACSSMARV